MSLMSKSQDVPFPYFIARWWLWRCCGTSRQSESQDSGRRLPKSNFSLSSILLARYCSQKLSVHTKVVCLATPGHSSTEVIQKLVRNSRKCFKVEWIIYRTISICSWASSSACQIGRATKFIQRLRVSMRWISDGHSFVAEPTHQFVWREGATWVCPIFVVASILGELLKPKRSPTLAQPWSSDEHGAWEGRT